MKLHKIPLVSCLLALCGPAPFIAASQAQTHKRAAPPAVSADRSARGKTQKPAEGAKLLAHLADPRITESSGLAQSGLARDLFWTHNDSGDGPYLYAINRKGETLARVTVPGATNVDWEDIASGPGESGRRALYIGDIGDNARNRTNAVVYRIDEPAVDPSRTMREVKSDLPDKFPFHYPDGPHDAETLLVHPKTGEMVIVTKEENGVSGVYAFPMPLKPSIPVVLEKTGSITFKSQFLSGISGRLAMGERMATAGDVSPDGRKIIIRTYLLGYEWTIPPGATIAQALKGAPRQIFLPLVAQGESICYRWDGKAVLMTSEKPHPPLYELPLP
jgi:hypothetical protein